MYLNNRAWILVYENADLRKKIFQYYLKSAERINTPEYQQNRKYELERKLNELIRDIRYRDESVTHDEAVKSANSLMETENREYLDLQTSIPKEVEKLQAYKGEAKDLIGEIESELVKL